jgi:hypothetical protein
VSKVAHTDAGLASALLNVGQQVGGALGLSVMTTVFGTSAKNYFDAHGSTLTEKVGRLPGNLPQLVGQRLQEAKGSSISKPDIDKFVNGLPPSERAPAHDFFYGPYKSFNHDLLAHASGQGFLMGAIFGVAAIIAAAVLINVTKKDLPTESLHEVTAAAA